tara:strand:+ start:2988 stop:4088 length:1101 start_codon:yes stop_codon:yes gene_type:complete
MNNYTVLGLMSGTSMDGLDCCLSKVSLDKRYNLKYEIIDFKTFDYSKNTKNIIKDALSCEDKKVELANEHLGKLFFEKSKKFIKNRKIDLIGSHGQTIFHRDKIKSLQIGDPSLLKKNFKIPIIYNFREKDILNGGNGAPLAPFLDWLLFNNEKNDTILINIGGLSNISYIKKNTSKDEVIGFDVGPGMCLIDQFSNYAWNKDLDYNAIFSSKGLTNITLLNELMKHPMIKKRNPKSMSREDFSIKFLLKTLKNKKISDYDIIRTLVSFSSEAIVYNINKYIKFNRKTNLVISGGGLNHQLLINEINNKLRLNKINLIEKKRIHPDCKEAFLMCVMAVANQMNLPSNMKKVTGSKKNVVLGEKYEN